MGSRRTERERIAGVYGRYSRDRRFAAKWDPTNPGNRAIEDERNEVLRTQLDRHGFWPMQGHRIADIGCGNGRLLAEFVRWGAMTTDLVGIDLLIDRATRARAVASCGVVLADARSIPLKDRSVELVAAFTIFSSVLRSRYREEIAREIDRVLAPGGALMWYDYRISDPLNRSTVGISRRELQRLFPEYTPYLETVTLVPQVARRIGRFTRAAYPVLARAPFLRTHYAGLLLKLRSRVSEDAANPLGLQA